MHLPPFIQRRLLKWADTFIDRRPRPTPPAARLQQCKIISHRGAHNQVPKEENTVQAFKRVAEAGVWGVEMDLRFTADLEPLVFHDADLDRVYGRHQKICDLTHDEIKRGFPAIPTLHEVVRRFGGKLHLMIEIKLQPWPDPHRQVSRLTRILSALVPEVDYHLLCLHPRALSELDAFSRQTRVVISEYCPVLLSRWIKRHRWGGLCGHYLLLGNTTIHALHRRGQKVGTGYVQSRNCLFREINRGVDWIFSNDAIHLQRIVDNGLADKS